jgi:ankyrin repeat protein
MGASNNKFTNMQDYKEDTTKIHRFKRKLEAITTRESDLTTSNKEAIKKAITKYQPFGIFNTKYSYYDSIRKRIKIDYLFFILLHYKFDDLCIEHLNSEYYHPLTAPKSSSGPLTSDHHEDTYLIGAIRHRALIVAELILAKGNSQPDYINSYRDTAFNWACYLGYDKLALELLALKEYRESYLCVLVNNGGHSPITNAMWNNLVEVLRAIFKICAVTYEQMIIKYTIVSSNTTDHLFFLLLNMKLYDIIGDYLDSGQMLPALTSTKGENCLGALLKTENAELIKKINFNKITYAHEKQSILEYACRNNLHALALKLAAAMPSKYITANDQGITPVCYAVKNKMTDVVEILLNKIVHEYQNLELDAATYRYLTVKFLENAVQMNNLEYIDLLIGKFTYDYKDIVTVYCKSSKVIKDILTKKFDVVDSSVLVEKMSVLISSINSLQ